MAKWGNWEVSMATRGRPSKQAPTPDARAYPAFGNSWGRPQDRPLPKPTPYNLRRFGDTPVMRRPMNIIKNEVLALPHEFRPKKGVRMSDEIRRQILVSSNIVDEPNLDDDYAAFWGASLDDQMLLGSSPLEIKPWMGNPDRPWMLWPMDAGTVDLILGWNGDARGLRYAQRVPGEAKPRYFADEQVIYIKPNPRTWTPFGLGPGEVAFNTVNAFLNSFSAASRLAANKSPDYLIQLGQNAKPEDVIEFREYWIDMIEGQGMQPIIGGFEDPEILRLTKGDDQDLRLAWLQFLMRIVAISFDVSAGKMGLSKDINRSTKEGEMEEDESGAIGPWAQLIRRTINRRLLKQRLGFTDIEMVYTDYDANVADAQARIHQTYYNIDVLSPDEIREDIGREPHEDGRGKLLRSQREPAAGPQDPNQQPSSKKPSPQQNNNPGGGSR